MLNYNKKEDLNQISLTGARALVLIELLIAKPLSIQEIKKNYIDYKLMEPTSSDDTIRIDLSTLRAMGCKITKASAKTNYKYILTEHPFSLKITDINELSALKKAYNSLKSNLDLITLIKYEELFKKIATYTYDEDTKENILGICSLKYYDLQMIKDLINDCKQKRTLILNYQKTKNSQITQIEVITQKIILKNEKVYLYGQNNETQKPIILNLRRIKSILFRKLNKENIETSDIIIKFQLKNMKNIILEDDEILIETTNNGYIIEGKYHNDFIAAQRILSFGDNCTVIEPYEFKENIIKKIKEMRKTYDC